MSDSKSITLAHLSDIHLPLTVGFTPRYWNTKRVLGWLNWQRKRRFIHTRAALDAIIADIKSRAPDHILVSGDLVNIGLPGEYEAARDWLAAVGTPDRVSVVPGNHDAYVTAEAQRGIGLWAPYMANDAFGQSLGLAGVARLGGTFPYVRRAGPIVIIGVSSGIATRPGSAIGEVGAAQLAKLGEALTMTRAAGLVRVVMIHHPPLPRLATGGRVLIDRVEMARTLERYGAELVVHGHNHTMTRVMHAGIPIEGVASASAIRANGHEPPARYNLITIHLREGARSIEIETRGFDPAGKSVGTIGSTILPQHLQEPRLLDKATTA